MHSATTLGGESKGCLIKGWDRDSEVRDSKARASENRQIHGPLNSDTP